MHEMFHCGLESSEKNFVHKLFLAFNKVYQKGAGEYLRKQMNYNLASPWKFFKKLPHNL